MTSDLEQEIAETREDLADTIDALGAKLDVKARAKETFAEANTSTFVAAGVLVIGAIASYVLWPRGH